MVPVGLLKPGDLLLGATRDASGKHQVHEVEQVRAAGGAAAKTEGGEAWLRGGVLCAHMM